MSQRPNSRTGIQSPTTPPVNIIHINAPSRPQSVAHSMHAPEQQEEQPDTTMISVVPGNFPITPEPPRTHTEPPVVQTQPEQTRAPTIRDFIPNLPGYQGLSATQWNTNDPANTWEQPLNPPQPGAPVNPPRFSPNNPFAQIPQESARTVSDHTQSNPLNDPPSTTRTPTSVSHSGQIEDRTMRIHDHIPIPPPAPRVHRYQRTSPDPILFNLPEAGNVAAAAQRVHPGRAEPWAQLETWIHTAMRELGGYLEVNFHETFSRIDSVRRDIDQLQGVVTGISEEQNNFRMVVDSIRESSFVTNDRITLLGNGIHDLNQRTNSIRRSLTTTEGQLTIQHGTLVGLQETTTQIAQSFREMNQGLGNLHQEIISDVRQHTSASNPDPKTNTPSTRTESPEGFSLKDRPSSTPAVPRTTPSGFPMSEGYRVSYEPPRTKRVSIAPVPEGDTTVKPTFLGGIEEEEEDEQGDEETIQEMESRFRKTLRDEDKDKAKIALPKYSGMRGNDANSWIVAMENYILYYPSKFQDEKSKIMVALNVLSETTSTKLWVTPLMRKVLTNERTLATRNWESFKDNFIQNFGDPAAHQNAFHKIKNLRQTTSVADYATRFRIIAGDLRDPTDEMLSLFFVDGLKDSIRDHVRQVQTMDQRERNLEQWIAMAIQQDNFEQQNRRTYGSNTNTTKTTSNITRPNTNANASTTPKRQLTDVEYARRREGNLCIKCGKGPHKARDCKGTWVGPFKEEVKGKVATIEEVSSETNTESEN